MRLLSCHVENFGILHDVSIEWNRELTCVCNGNGWGKSTLAAFLGAMFYGLDGDRKRSVEDNERKRYMPWQGGVFGGSLVLEQQGKRYELVRTFGAKESQDTFELRNADTNLPSDDYTERIGEELFRIDRESFIRTIYIGRSNCETQTTDAVNARIGNMEDSAGDLNHFEQAYALLTEQMNRLTPNRKTGSIAGRKEEIAELSYKASQGTVISEELQACASRMAEQNARYDEMQNKMEQLTAEQQQAAQMQKHLVRKEEQARLAQSLQRKKEALAQWETEFPNGVPSMPQIQRAYVLSERLDEQNRRMDKEALQAEERERLEELNAFFNDEKRGTNFAADKTPGRLWMGIGFALLCIGIVLLIALPSHMPGVAICLIGVLAAIFGWRLQVDGERSNRGKEEERNRKMQLYTRLHEKEQDERLLREQQRKTAEELQHFFNTYCPKDADAGLRKEVLDQMATDVQAYQSACLGVREAETALASLNPELPEGMAETQPNPDRTPESIGAEMTALAAALRELRSEMTEEEKKAERMQTQYDQWNEDCARLTKLQEIQEQEQATFRLLKQTRDKLSRAKETLVSAYCAPVLSAFSGYYEQITGDTAVPFHMDANLTLTMEQAGRQRELLTQSTGIRELSGFCYRLALVDAMYEAEKPMLILDDPFIYLDDARMQSAKTLLQSLSKRYQIIYFTCSDVRSIQI